MRLASFPRLSGLVFPVFFFASSLAAQQTSSVFHWVNFHSPQDESIVVWVTRSLQVDQWTAIREIGVQYDAALVITSFRASPQALPADDTFTVWSASLTSHLATRLITGVNLRLFDWERFTDGGSEDLTALYDNCRACSTQTYFTAFYYDVAHHMWGARWVNGGQGGGEGAPVWTANTASEPGWTQVYAVLAAGDGHVELCTWNHFDYGKEKPPTDVLYCYDRDPFSGLDCSQALGREQAEQMEVRLCRGQDAVQGLERGQDSPLCQELVNPRNERRPVTTPPANNRGRSVPPGSHK
jgi:hypothetical protein